MKRAIAATILPACAAWLAFGQSTEAPPKFEIADVHYVSSKTADQYLRTRLVNGGHFEVKNATMADLVGIAYGFAADKVLGGPNWLELDRFDVIAKAPADATADTRKAMLQALLADRFKLVVHKDTKPMPALALSVGKKAPAQGSRRPGADRVQAAILIPPARYPDGRAMFANPNGTTPSSASAPA